MNMAGLRWRTGDLEGSSRHYEEALEIAREHGEAAHEAVRPIDRDMDLVAEHR